MNRLLIVAWLLFAALALHSAPAPWPDATRDPPAITRRTIEGAWSITWQHTVYRLTLKRDGSSEGIWYGARYQGKWSLTNGIFHIDERCGPDCLCEWQGRPVFRDGVRDRNTRLEMTVLNRVFNAPDVHQPPTITKTIWSRTSN